MITRNMKPQFFVSSFLLLAGILHLASCTKPQWSQQLTQPAFTLSKTSVTMSLAAPVVGTMRVLTFAGSGTSGFRDDIGTAASFASPAGLAFDAAGNIYVADKVNHRIRKITRSGAVTTFAGTGTRGFKDGAANVAQFNFPASVAVDPAGNVFVADNWNQRIRKITPDGQVSTFAGTGTPGFTDGPGTSAQFDSPNGVATDAAGNVYVADPGNQRIRKITASGLVSTFAGNGNPGVSDGPPAFAQFTSPANVAVGATGNVYVADAGNNLIRVISPSGVTSTLAGSGAAGNTDGGPAAASFNSPYGVGVDANGNVFVADQFNDRIRQVTPDGVVSTLAGSTTGFLDAAPALSKFNLPNGVAVDPSGNVFIADALNHRIREIGSFTLVSTVAGNGSATFSNGTAMAASFYFPMDLTKDAAGNLYIADFYNHMIRKITPAGSVSTLAGTTFGPLSGSFVEGPGSIARFNGPSGVAVDASGTLYVSDLYNNRIRKVTPAGVVSTLAGNANAGYSEGAGAAATFNAPTSVALDAAGNVYVSDYYNHRIRKIAPSGLVSTLAGSGVGAASGGYAEGPGTTAKFNYPMGLAVDASGNVFVADAQNHRVRKITPAGEVSTVAGTGTKGFLDGSVSVAQFNGPSAVKLDAAGNIYVVDSGNGRIRVITTTGKVSTLAGYGGGGLFGGYADGPGNLAIFASPCGLEVTANGIYVADTWNSRIRIIQ